MSINLQLHETFQYLVNSGRHQEVIDTVHFAINQRKAVACFSGTRRAFLRSKKLDGLFAKAVNNKMVHDCKLLAQVLQELHVPGNELFGFQESHVPWDAWKAGRKVVIIIGGKFATRRSDLETQVVGGQDATALCELGRTLRDHAGLQYVSETVHVSPTMPSAEAEELLDWHCRQPDVGAVIVLGSEIVNPFAAPMARLIFDGMNPRDMPVHYRWAYDHSVQKPFLASSRVCKLGNEGIALTYQEAETSLRRVSDQEVVEAIRKGKGKRRYGPFLDCAILALSFGPNGTILVLCSGHGGCGTTAAVYGLGRVDYVAKRLEESDRLTNDQRYIPPGTILEPIWVKRRKKTLELIDDFKFDKAYGTGWKFYFDDDDELEDSVPSSKPQKQKTC